MVTARLRLGQLLVDARMLTQEALDRALEQQRTDGRRLGTLLVEQGLINETQLTQILSHQLAVPWVSLLHIEFSRQLLNLVPHDVAERYCLVPIYVRHVRNQGETLYVAMDDPTNEEGLKECMTYSGLPVRAMIAPPSDIRNAIRVYYGADARPAAPQMQVLRAPPSEPAARLRPSTEARAEANPAPSAGPERRPSQMDLAPASAARTASRSNAELQDDALPAIEATEVDDAEVAIFEDDTDAWEPTRPVRVPVREERPAPPVDQRSRPTIKVAPPPELLAAAQPERRLAARKESAEGTSGGPTSAGAAALLGAVLGRPVTPVRSVPEASDDPPSEREVKQIPSPPGRGRARMVSLTLLDGTTITLPARGGAKPQKSDRRSEPPPPPDDPGLTARDLVAALRAVSHGADASEILGNNVRWEAMFAAILSLLLKKHLVADWEFVDELKNI